MNLIRRAAAFAYSFVSLNYQQAVAFRYLVRSSDQGRTSPRAAAGVGCRRYQQGGAMSKVLFVGFAMAGIVAVTGSPNAEAVAPAMADAVRQAVAAVWLAPSSAAAVAPWTESATLLVLATGFFGAAVLLRRRGR